MRYICSQILANKLFQFFFKGGALPIPRPGADGSYGKGDYFQYINVPAPKVFEWGYRRGNDPNHFREEYLSQKDHAFKAKVTYSICFVQPYKTYLDSQLQYLNKRLKVLLDWPLV